MTATQAASLYGYHPQTVLYHCQQGHMGSKGQNGKWYVTHADMVRVFNVTPRGRECREYPGELYNILRRIKELPLRDQKVLEIILGEEIDKQCKERKPQ